MSAQLAEPDEPADDLSDLLPDDLLPTPKGAAKPLVRTKAQTKAVAKRQADAAAKAQLQAANARLAQIVNLHIGGFSLSQIGESIGASAEEVDRLLAQDTARYVKTQPALRTYVRNWVSERYTKMIEADWDAASDPKNGEKLEHQDRVMRMLDRMAKLHGAEAPVQSEVKVDATPATVDAVVKRLAQGQGLAYDDDIFDVPDADIHEAVEVAHEATVVSGNAVEQPQEGDRNVGF